MENNTIKLSLFDVTDLNNPTEIAKYTIDGYYASSTALNDPKAFLFDLQKQLLVIPVSVSFYGELNQSTQVIPPVIGQSGSISPIYLEHWQGACVFNVNPNSGFTLKGTVTHLDAASFDSFGYVNDTLYYGMQNNLVTRSLYIGNTLYTVSNAEVKLNSLTDMSEITAVNLS